MTLLDMSISGAIIIMVIVFIRALAINRLPKKTFLLLWGVALCRLLVPFDFSSPLSVYNLIWQVWQEAEASQMQIENAITFMPPMRQLPTGISATGFPADAINIPLLVWSLGAFALAAHFAVAYFLCRREFQMALPVQNDYAANWLSQQTIKRTITIRQSSRISAPLTYGAWKPIILMPANTNWQNTKQIEYVLAHELVHIKRFDTVTKLLLTSALCIHWFNPLVWAMYILSNRDIELSCDETVIHSFGDTTKSAYARTLISMEESKNRFTPLCNNFSKNAIEERITAIMKMKKATVLSLILACFLVAGTTTAFATSAYTTVNDKTDNDNTGSIIEEGVMLSSLDGNGKVSYSIDGGRTFLSEGDLKRQYPSMDIEWWTYEEYKAWLENEKAVLQSMLGEKAYTGGRGEFIWTQEIIDETIAMYEKDLQDIKDGLQISKPIAGSDDVMVSYHPDENTVIGTAEGVVIVFDNGEKVAFGPYDTTTELLAEVKPYCEQQVQLGNMTQDEANKILEKYAS